MVRKTATRVLVCMIAAGALLAGAAGLPAPSAPLLWAEASDTCVPECHLTYREHVKACHANFPEKAHPRDHQECFHNARSSLDGCLLGCQ